MSDFDVSTTHHTLAVEPWGELPGGVLVRNWADCEDAFPAVMLLLRDRSEVSALITALQHALAVSERRGPARGLVYNSALDSSTEREPG